MIQFNLLPDVKLEYIKAQRSRRLALSIAFLSMAVSIALLGVLVGFGQLQKVRSNSLSDSIADNSKKLKNEPQIDKVLTVQNQLQSLTGLHDKKPAATRLFEYLNAVTPAEVDITSFTLDSEGNTMELTGTASALSDVNKYVDTLKFTKYSVDNKKDTQIPAFSDVVLSSFGLSDPSANTGKTTTAKASYTINLVYDPVLFDITQKVSLNVPSGTTTRSEVDKPADLFTGTPNVKTDSKR